MVNKPKSSSHKRPAPFPKDVKKMPPVKQKRKEKSRKPLKGIEAEQKRIEVEKSASETSENISSDNESSEDECPNLAGIKFTVKRDWDGQVNYYPANEEHFTIYYPENLEEKNKLIWKQMVNKRKQAISEERISKIFGSANNIKKVRYCNRLRLSFPCPEEACSFQTVDLKKHLLSKNKWD